MPTEWPAQTVIAVVARNTINPPQLGVKMIAEIPPAIMTNSQIDFSASQ